MELSVVPNGMFGAAAADAFLTLTSGFDQPVVGLATGNSPIPMYDDLRLRVYDGDADLSRVRPFAVDEYGGARQHHCSNHSFFARYWAPIPRVRPVHEFDPSVPELAVECARFAVELERAGGLDVAVLGLGLNGHLAFNEPGSRADSPARVVPLAPQTRASARVCWQDDTPSYGLTLGLRELLAARRVLLLVNGPHKAEIVAAALHGPVDAICPASFLQEHPALTVVANGSAGRLLTQRG